MHYFTYKNGTLHAEDVSLAHIAQEVGTPFYCYSSTTLERHYQVFAEAFASHSALICYSVKANSNLAVLKTLANLGAGMDVVSGGELARALAVGVAGEKIIFSGVGKSPDEMAQALDANILCFNVESEPELEMLNKVAGEKGKTAPVSLRINPDVDAKTHAKISTGKAQDKFGIPWADAKRVYGRAKELPHIEVCGVDMHIGSQITDLGPFTDAFSLLRDLVLDLRQHGHDIRHIDLGGGLGVPYHPDQEAPPSPAAYGDIVTKALGDLGCQFIFEPGRLIAANAGILVAQVLYVKESAGKKFTIIDAAMNDLIRPTLYEAYHDIMPVNAPNEGAAQEEKIVSDFVGPICETGDYLAQARLMPPLKQGDLVAIMTAGAYGAVQSGTYNSRPLVSEIMVKGANYAAIRPRQTIEQLLGLDQVPDWLA